MTHYHLEIIMPSTDNIEGAVADILKPFSENNEDSTYSFWDWYKLGGRWSGEKIKDRVGKENLEKFYEELKKQKITVSSIQFGKQELSPHGQEKIVDEIWRNLCPGGGNVCTLFKHSGEGFQTYDVCFLGELSETLTSDRLIIAVNSDDSRSNKFLADHMISQSMWNGVSHVKTSFNGVVKTECEKYIKKCRERFGDEWLEINTPKDNWLVVTVDYHS